MQGSDDRTTLPGPNAFTPAFLQRLGELDEPPSAGEADVAGPWNVEEIPGFGFGLFRPRRGLPTAQERGCRRLRRGVRGRVGGPRGHVRRAARRRPARRRDDRALTRGAGQLAGRRRRPGSTFMNERPTGPCGPGPAPLRRPNHAPASHRPRPRRLPGRIAGPLPRFPLNPLERIRLPHRPERLPRSADGRRLPHRPERGLPHSAER